MVHARPRHKTVGRLALSRAFGGHAVSSPYYEIRVAGTLPPEALLDFERLTASVHQVETVLHGPLQDQAALHGLLARLRRSACRSWKYAASKTTARRRGRRRTSDQHRNARSDSHQACMRGKPLGVMPRRTTTAPVITTVLCVVIGIKLIGGATSTLTAKPSGSRRPRWAVTLGG